MKKMRKMKKMMSVFAAAALALTALPAAVFAADSAGLEQAIATAKFKIEIPAEYTEFDSFIQEDDRMEKNYELRWSTKGDDYTSAKSIEVSINSHGDVISYWTSSDSYDGDVQFAAYNGQQLRDIAREWLFGVNPGWADELPEDAINYAPYSDLRSRTENVSFERRVNGLPFCSNRVSVSVNTATGQVTGMWANWNYEASVPDPASAMENEAAQKAFLGLSPLELQYINTGDDHGVLAYVPAHAYALVDAVTGKEMVQGSARYSGGGASTKNAMSEAAADQAADAGGYRLTEAELSNVEEIAGLKSQEELKNIAAGLANTGLDTAQFESCRYARAYSKDENVPAEYHATLRFLFQPGTEQECSGIVVLDAKTGQLQGYNSYTMRDYVSSESVARANTVTYDQARAAADAFARAYGGDEYAFAQLVPAEDEEQAMKYHPYFEFRRIENGVPYPNNSLNVSVDETSGRILGFHKNWDKTMTFETTEGVIDTEAAQKALMERVGMQLIYTYAQQDEDAGKYYVALAYTLNHEGPSMISAKTGELMNYDGSAYVPGQTNVVLPDDLAGHYGQAQIEKLFQVGMLSLEEDQTSFRPDEEITQAELLAFVSGLKRGQVLYKLDEASLTGLCRRLHILNPDEQFDAQAKALRQDGPKFIVRALDYEKIATLPGIFNCGFADRDAVAQGMEGYVAIARGLGIIRGDEQEMFHPGDTLTRADAAIMIYNYLSR